MITNNLRLGLILGVLCAIASCAAPEPTATPTPARDNLQDRIAAVYGVSDATARCALDAGVELHLDIAAEGLIVYVCMTDEEATAADPGVAQGIRPSPSIMRCVRDNMELTTREFVDIWPGLTEATMPAVSECGFHSGEQGALLSAATLDCIDAADWRGIPPDSDAGEFMTYLCLTDLEASAGPDQYPPSAYRCLRDDLMMTTREFVDWWPEDSQLEHLEMLDRCYRSR